MRKYIPDTTKLHFVPNPVMITENSRVKAEENEYLVFIGRLSYEKGVVLLAQAAQRLSMPLVLIGDGELSANLRQKYPNFPITGWLSPEGVAGWLGKARALIVPSVWYETFGLVAYEALAKGVPVIVADRCIASEAVRDGETGLLFPTGDLDGLVHALSQIKDDELVKSMSMAAHKIYWERPFTLDLHLNALESCYSKMQR